MQKMMIAGLALVLAMPAMALASHTPSPTLPDTSCASAVGVGASDIPHAYYTANGIVTFTNDACPDHFSGELGFGVGGVWFFARTGADANGDGSGVVACYGSTDPTAGPTTGHHGSHNTINVRDDVLGGSVGFTVTRDYNRSATNPQVPSTNSGGAADCGDNIVEPCTPAQEAETDPTSPNYVAGGCNSLDASTFVFPQDGICTGVSSLGDLFNPTGVVATVVAIVTGLVTTISGDPQGAPWGISPACEHAVGPNTWTAPNTLGEYAGADGAIVIFIESNFRADAGHFGTGTTGAAWTSSV